MNTASTLSRSFGANWRNALRAALASACLALAACGGGSADAPPPPESGGAPTAVPPTITQQPGSLGVTAGQGATFTVAATGTAPLAYQWQRNGVDIAGATTPSYALTTAAIGDSGAVFRAVVSNLAGSATSNGATLTVTVAPPVLTITPQPADASVVAGATASFTVGGTCSLGALNIQWQRRASSAGTFAVVSGATDATYSFVTATGDSGTQVRANLDCGGQSGASSSIATLAVTAPGGVTLSLYPVNGLRDQARVTGAAAIDRLADGSYAVAVGAQLKRLSADLSTLTALAGSSQQGYADGPATTALFRLPFGIAHDAAGVLYVTDRQNYVIRRVAADGTVSTLAGTAGQQGTTDGTGAAARFQDPVGIALGPDGDLYVADAGNNVVRRVTTAGVVTTYAGSGTRGLVDGPAASAQFASPTGIGIASNGDVIVTDYANSRVRRILRSATGAGNVETLAGTTGGTQPGADGPGATAVIFNPGGVAVVGNVAYVRDAAGLVRAIDLGSGAVSTFAGSRTRLAGYADGPLGQAQLDGGSLGITAGASGGLLLAETKGLRSLDAAGTVTTIAATNPFETDAGTGVLAQLPLSAASITVDSQGRVANFDFLSRAVRRVDTSGNVSLVAGLTGGAQVYDGQGSAAQFSARDGSPIAAAASSVLFVGDGAAVRRVAADGTVATIAGDVVNFGLADGPGATARFNSPSGLGVAANGDVIVADTGGYALRKVDATGQVTTIAGGLGVSGFADGAAVSARLQGPRRLTITPDGSVWFIDGPRPDTAGIRKLSADGTTVSSGFAGLPSINLAAITSDANGILYVMQNADLAQAGRLISYDPAAGTVTTLVPAGIDQTLRLGAGGSLPVIRSIAVLGPKRILLTTSAGQLVLATLP